MSVRASESHDGYTVTLHIDGRFDFSSHQAFVAAYKAYEQGAKQFVVDFKNTEYLDSSALGMLLQLREHNRSGAQVQLINESDTVSEILRIANFDKLFKLAA